MIKKYKVAKMSSLQVFITLILNNSLRNSYSNFYAEKYRFKIVQLKKVKKNRNLLHMYIIQRIRGVKKLSELQ